MKPIIKVENLSKQYKLGGEKKRYSTLRESLTDMARLPLKIFQRTKENGNNKFWALKDINFEVMPGEVVGIIGRNGAGKSTLLKVLSRITEPTKGRIELYGRVGSLLEVGTGFHPELTGRENIYLNGAILGMRRGEIIKKFDEIVDFAEIEKFLDTPVKHYSSGMYTKLAFSVAANLNPEVLIVDEVLAVGDVNFQKKCLGKMQDVSNSGRTVLFVSHNMTTISDLCRSAILLEEGQIKHLGKIDETVKLYLDKGNLWEAYFKNRAVCYASVEQILNEIKIVVEYEVKYPLRFPCLGFTISNQLGQPVCGTNALHDKVEPLTKAQISGKVVVKIKQPKLIDGTYRLSLWFGNGTEDYFIEKDCLSFNVSGLSANQHNKATAHGHVYPICDWQI